LVALRFVAVDPVPPEGNHEYVYPGVPPDGFTLAVPFEPPLQETFVCEGEAVMAVGAVSVTICCVVHPFASVIVHV
jgi:hypothetical protein